jgi:hypothetical protein
MQREQFRVDLLDGRFFRCHIPRREECHRHQHRDAPHADALYGKDVPKGRSLPASLGAGVAIVYSTCTHQVREANEVTGWRGLSDRRA